MAAQMRAPFIAIAALWSAAAAAHGFEYKGVPLGGAETALIKAQPSFRCAPSPPTQPYDRVCSATSGTYAGAPIKGATAAFISDRLVTVTVGLELRHLPAVLEALRDAHGGGQREKQTNGSPAYRWRKGDTSILVFPFGSMVFVEIESSVFAADIEKKREQRRKQGAKDL
jgi:hypothetical protein